MISGLLALGAGFYLLGLDRLELEQRKSARYYAQVAAYQMLEGQYRQLERLRHDMKNHVIALSELLKNREWEKMGSYLEAMGRWGRLVWAGKRREIKLWMLSWDRKRKGRALWYPVGM